MKGAFLFMGTNNNSNRFMDLLPNPLPDIYRANSTNVAVKNYVNTLSLELKNNPSDNNLRLMQNACKEYLFLISSKNIYSRTRKNFNNIHQYTVKNHKDIFVQTIARSKSWISFFNKAIIKLLSNKSLDSIRDIYACRSILDSQDGKDSMELIKKCYEVMDENINYLITLGFIPCDAEPLKDTEDFVPSEHPEIIVPKHSYLSQENQSYVKDYIATPKSNTYQSLHVIFRDTYGNYFEYQVRTYSMDKNAEHGKASHSNYKNDQKKKRSIPKLNIERENIHISGYRFSDGEVDDDSGIEKSVSILKRTRRIS